MKEPQTKTTVVKRECSLCGAVLREEKLNEYAIYGGPMFWPKEANHVSTADCVGWLASEMRRMEIRQSDNIRAQAGYVKKGDVIPMTCNKGHKWWRQR